MKKLTCSLLILISALTHADLTEGLAALDKKDYATALKELKPLANNGDATAQYKLGFMYYIGRGVTQDYIQAVSCFRKAAEQGHFGAQYNLGVMYDKGQGVTQDYTQAVSWYRKAAEQGYANAQSGLGDMYSEGKGVTQDYIQAVSWYRKAAEQGSADAQFGLGAMYSEGKGVAQDYDRAIFWYRLAAAQHNASALNNLGVFFDKGDFVSLNIPLAYALYNLAATYDASDKLYSENRDKRLKQLEQSGQVAVGQAYTRQLANSKDFDATLMKIVKSRTTQSTAPKSVELAKNQQTNSPWPDRPTKRAGVVSCNTNCDNGQCWRVYDSGKKVQFQAKRTYNPLSSQFEWDSGTCR